MQEQCVFFINFFELYLVNQYQAEKPLSLLVENFCKKGTVMKSKLPGLQKLIWMSENIEHVH